MTTPPVAPLPPPSALDAAGDAVEHTRRRLFPVRVEHWLLLGFLAFLDQCGRGGLSFPSGGDGGGRGGGNGDLGDLAAWLASNLGLVVAVTAGALALAVAVIALVLWINSRGIFMYLDAVVTGRGDVRRTWHEHAEPAGSLFAWRFVIALGALLFVVLLLASGVALVIVTGRGGGEPSPVLLIGALVVLVVVVVPVSFGVLLFSVALRDFVAPLQLCLRVACGDAVRVLFTLLRAHPGTFVVYLLLKLLFSIAAGIVFVAACCFTCCLAALPVLSQALLQPLWYFERSWPVFLLRRMGHDLFTSFPGLPPAPAAPAGPFAPFAPSGPPAPSAPPTGERPSATPQDDRSA